MSITSNKFDAIIIGSGIGGLTCGNYLAKAGLKVAIFEQHYKPGGCCSSFTRKGFTFDSGVHSLGDLGKKGNFSKIIRELGIEKKIRFIRKNPAEKIIFPSFNFTLGSNIDETKAQLQNIFPDEARNIDSFFNFVKNSDFKKLYQYLRNKTFKNVIDTFFVNASLKKIFYSLIGPIGTVPLLRVSALSAVVFCKQWIFGGGYYPYGGMQNLSDVFAKNFESSGGKIYLNAKVNRVIIKNKKAAGIILQDNSKFFANFIISNADSRQTFFDLVGKSNLPERFTRALFKMQPTMSCFAVYLGLNRKLMHLGMVSNICYLYKIEEYNLKQRKHNGYLSLFSSSLHDSSLAPINGDTLILARLVPYRSEKYWKENKLKIADGYIKKAEQLLPGLSRHIIVKEIATPCTYYKYTLNYKGAIGGWATLINQDARLRLGQITPVNGLYLVGHWTQPGEGINNVALSGATIAKKILFDYNLNT